MSQPPSFQDVQAMSELVNLMDDIETGTPVAPMKHNNSTALPNELVSVCSTDRSGDKAVMGNIMASLDDAVNLYDGSIAKKYASTPVYESADTPALPLNASEEDIYTLLSRDLQNQNNAPIDTPALSRTTTPTYSGDEYVVLTDSFKGANIKTYSIQNAHTKSIVASDLALKESANALSNMLNTGTPITDVKFLGILSMGIQYTQLFEDTFSKIKKRQDVLKECNYSAAQQMDSDILAGKEKANSIKHDLVMFLTKEHIRYK